MAGIQSSGTSIGRPFGDIPTQLAGREQRQLSPYLTGLGFDPSLRFENRLAQAQGPEAALIRQLQGFLPGVYGQAQGLGQQTAARGEAGYEALTNQINQGLGATGQGLQYAQQFARQAFSPTAEQPLYLEASREMLNQIRPGLAGRGLVGGGEGQRAETDATRDLRFSLLQQQAAQQAAVPGMLGQAAMAGPQLAQGGLGAVGEAAQLGQQAYNTPLQALGSVLQMITAQQQPTSGLIGVTQPMGLGSSKGLNVL